jgi:hypothetical protein
MEHIPQSAGEAQNWICRHSIMGRVVFDRATALDRAVTRDGPRKQVTEQEG